MDAQTRVSRASYDAITYVKEGLAVDIIEAQRRGIVLKGVAQPDLERLIAVISQSVDARFQTQVPSFLRIVASSLEECKTEGRKSAEAQVDQPVAAEGTRRKK